MSLPSQPTRTEKEERQLFPHLAYLMSGWLHEDYELMGGPTVEGILADFRENTTPDEQSGVVADIQKFLTGFGISDTSLRQAMEKVFYPCFVVEGWEGLTTRQWLLKVARDLQSQ